MCKNHHHGHHRGSRVSALVVASGEIAKVHELMASNRRYAALAIRAAQTGNKRLAALIVKRAGVTRPFSIRIVRGEGIGVCFKVKGRDVCFFLNIL